MSLKPAALEATEMFDSISDTQLSFGIESANFHNIVLEALSEAGNERRAKDRLCNEIKLGVYDEHALTQIDCYSNIGIRTARAALLNVVDFLFEGTVLKSMRQQQLLQYFSAIENTMTVKGPLNSSFGRGLIIETVHHCAIFSIGVVLARELVRQGGKNRLILLNQGQRPEPRLSLSAGVLNKFYGLQCHVLPLQGMWYKKLAKLMSPTTAVVYLADMPLAMSEGQKQKEKVNRSLRLSHANTTQTGIIETESAAQRLSQKLSADHVTVDFPDRATIAVNPDVDTSVPLRCNIEDWAFGPAVKTR